MIPRLAQKTLRTLAKEFKIVGVVGPRQSGKTTLVRFTFPEMPYVNLEDPDRRAFAQEDPRGFLNGYQDGAVFDEIQRCPDLFPYLQGIVDETGRVGHFILTGSQHFGLMEQVSQSLAGRVGFLELLPFSFMELEAERLVPESFDQLLFSGAYPPIFDPGAAPERWYNAYISTYLERDVRQIVNIRDLSAFQRFLKLCAANVGQLLNTSRIGADCGVNHSTVRTWLNVLEVSGIVCLLRPHFKNFRRRLVKTPKIYFTDTGLCARLLGIESYAHVSSHPLRGALFENWVIVEALKMRLNQGKESNLYFWRNHIGQEIDLIADHGAKLMPVEIKSGQTIARDWLKKLDAWMDLAGSASEPAWLVYGGEESYLRSGIHVLSWRLLSKFAKII